MHRHGYVGRKFGRERDQRRALLKGLADALIQYETIETTLPKAKELSPYIERLITKAKKGDLHNRRQIIAAVNTITTAHKLVDELAPRMQSRSSGHVRIVRSRNRKGDNAQLATISFIFDEQPKTGSSSEKSLSVDKPKKAKNTSAPQSKETMKKEAKT
jgi:large subunit ribosomal protein L17